MTIGSYYNNLTTLCHTISKVIIISDREVKYNILLYQIIT